MSEETIVTDQTSELTPDEATEAKNGSALTRRDFLQHAIAVASGLAIGSMLPGAAKEFLISEAQAQSSLPTCLAPGQTLQKIMEITSHGSGPGKTLKAVLKLLDENKAFLAQGTNGPACNTGQMRYFSGYDATSTAGNRQVWPTASGVPSPAPTLRAGVGDRVEITLINNVNVKNFPNTLDVAEHGQACDQNTTFGQGNTYPGDPMFENPPNCYHGSSSCNLHFHGAHTSPSGIADNVLLNIRPSPRDAKGQPIITEQSVGSIFSKIFMDCEHGHQPMEWKEWPPDWQSLQQKLLVQYDNTTPWMGQSPTPGHPALPLTEQLWYQNEEQIKAHELPQYYIGAFPNCFNIPTWNGQPTSMGQAPGTHWYHAHKHGSTTLNLANGMAGALIIEGDYDATLKSYYQGKGMTITERVLVLQQFCAVLDLLRATATRDLVSVNGQFTPVVEMKPNETQFWRIVNACHEAEIPLNTTAGLKWVQTAQDGVQLDPRNYDPDPSGPTNTSFPVPPRAVKVNGEWLSTGSLAAGNRIDLLVQAPSTAGDYKVTYTANGDTNSTLLFTVRVTGTAVAAVPFPTRDEFPKMPGFLGDIHPPIGMVKRDIHFNTTKTQFSSPTPTPTPQETTGGRNPANAQPPLIPNAPPTQTINGKQFSAEIDQYMKLGATEEWTLFNDTPVGGAAHPFHIHVNPFQVISLFDPTYMDASLATTGVPLRRPWVWWDTFAIPPGGWAKMWTRFVDYTGTYVFHCHILDHEDRGMMQLVNVSPAGTVMTHK
ncbi:MAG TPA: multicopper oxidase domain-containing protein [Pyrinomonadaceae bacterium]